MVVTQGDEWAETMPEESVWGCKTSSMPANIQYDVFCLNWLVWLLFRNISQTFARIFQRTDTRETKKRHKLLQQTHQGWQRLQICHWGCVLLENLLQDPHLLLLQLCHHVHTVRQTLGKSPYTHIHITSSIAWFGCVCLSVSVCVLIAYRSSPWWPWGLVAAAPCSSGPSASETSGSHLWPERAGTPSERQNKTPNKTTVLGG